MEVSGTQEESSVHDTVPRPSSRGHRCCGDGSSPLMHGRATSLLVGLKLRDAFAPFSCSTGTKGLVFFAC